MYIPKQHVVNDLNAMHALIRTHPLGAWIMHGGGELIANHVPFLLDCTRGEHGTLIAHVARANPVWQALTGAAESLVIFQGPQSYITPSWYPSKHEHGRAVPTWNYAVVHAHGVAQVIEDRAWLRDHLQQLTDSHEASQTIPWQVSDAPADFTDQLIGAIVGIEIPIQKIIGKWKTHQGRPEADKLGVIAGLTHRGDSNSMAMAELVQQHLSSGKTR